jgi:UDP-2-acetamido-3-amino-2,3-dideoxy-glucuronate N-acetyltransferase
MEKFLPSYIHPNALVEENTQIGENTRIWAFSHICKNVQIGHSCNICDHTYIESGVTIGNNVTIKCGVYIWKGVHLGNNTFIGPNVTFANDLKPKSGNRNFHLLETHIEDGASIGANATILPGIRIGKNALIGAGSVVTKNIPPDAIAFGNPARVKI